MKIQILFIFIFDMFLGSLGLDVYSVHDIGCVFDNDFCTWINKGGTSHSRWSLSKFSKVPPPQIPPLEQGNGFLFFDVDFEDVGLAILWSKKFTVNSENVVISMNIFCNENSEFEINFYKYDNYTSEDFFFMDSEEFECRNNNLWYYVEKMYLKANISDPENVFQITLSAEGAPLAISDFHVSYEETTTETPSYEISSELPKNFTINANITSSSYITGSIVSTTDTTLETFSDIILSNDSFSLSTLNWSKLSTELTTPFSNDISSKLTNSFPYTTFSNTMKIITVNNTLTTNNTESTYVNDATNLTALMSVSTESISEITSSIDEELSSITISTTSENIRNSGTSSTDLNTIFWTTSNEPIRPFIDISCVFDTSLCFWYEKDEINAHWRLSTNITDKKINIPSPDIGKGFLFFDADNGDNGLAILWSGKFTVNSGIVIISMDIFCNRNTEFEINLYKYENFTTKDYFNSDSEEFECRKENSWHYEENIFLKTNFAHSENVFQIMLSAKTAPLAISNFHVSYERMTTEISPYETSSDLPKNSTINSNTTSPTYITVHPFADISCDFDTSFCFWNAKGGVNAHWRLSLDVNAKEINIPSLNTGTGFLFFDAEENGMDFLWSSKFSVNSESIVISMDIFCNGNSEFEINLYKYENYTTEVYDFADSEEFECRKENSWYFVKNISLKTNILHSENIFQMTLTATSPPLAISNFKISVGSFTIKTTVSNTIFTTPSTQITDRNDNATVTRFYNITEKTSEVPETSSDGSTITTLFNYSRTYSSPITKQANENETEITTIKLTQSSDITFSKNVTASNIDFVNTTVTDNKITFTKSSTNYNTTLTATTITGNISTSVTNRSTDITSSNNAINWTSPTSVDVVTVSEVEFINTTAASNKTTFTKSSTYHNTATSTTFTESVNTTYPTSISNSTTATHNTNSDFTNTTETTNSMYYKTSSITFDDTERSTSIEFTVDIDNNTSDLTPSLIFETSSVNTVTEAFNTEWTSFWSTTPTANTQTLNPNATTLPLKNTKKGLHLSLWHVILLSICTISICVIFVLLITKSGRKKIKWKARWKVSENRRNHFTYDKGDSRPVQLKIYVQR